MDTTFLNYKYIPNDFLTNYFKSNKEEVTVHLCLYNINSNCWVEAFNKKNRQIDNTYIENINKIGSIDSLLENDYNDYSDNNINKNYTYPFIEYIFELKKDKYNFPKFKYEPVVINSTQNNDDNENYEDYGDYEYDEDEQLQSATIHFENTCFLEMFKLFDNIPKTNINIKSIYKGFIKKNETDYFVFFDLTELLIENVLKNTYTFAILDEILYIKKIWDIPFHLSVLYLFKKYKFLRYLKNNNDIEYPIPIRAYMCEKKNDVYITKNNILYPSYIKPFGFCYFMTNTMLSDKPQRFACFIVNCLYNIELKESSIFIVQKNEKLREVEGKKLTEALLLNSTFFFNDIDIQIIGIKDNLQITEIR